MKINLLGPPIDDKNTAPFSLPFLSLFAVVVCKFCPNSTRVEAI